MRDPLEHGSNRAIGSRTVRRFKSKWTYPGKNVRARQSLETFFFGRMKITGPEEI